MEGVTQAGLEQRLVALRQEHAALDAKIADLGFRRAAVQGAIMEVQRWLRPAESHGHQG